jgi:hypothetical protein
MEKEEEELLNGHWLYIFSGSKMENIQDEFSDK